MKKLLSNTMTQLAHSSSFTSASLLILLSIRNFRIGLMKSRFLLCTHYSNSNDRTQYANQIRVPGDRETRNITQSITQNASGVPNAERA